MSDDEFAPGDRVMLVSPAVWSGGPSADAPGVGAFGTITEPTDDDEDYIVDWDDTGDVNIDYRNRYIWGSCLAPAVDRDFTDINEVEAFLHE